MTDDDNELMPADTGEFIVYASDDGRFRAELHPIDGTIWMTQAQISELFDKSVKTISEHIQNIYEDKECTSGATFRKFRRVQMEGGREVTRSIDAYSLELILAVGFRVRSARASQFRRWANTVLQEYLIKGFAIDDRRLKNPWGVDYFDELLERIRDIRASEKRFYQKVKDIFTTAIDYDSSSPIAREFFATVQNKITYAVTGSTAAELVVARSDATKDNMGLTSWDGRRVKKADTKVAKNYLNQDEISELNRLSTMYLDFAEDRAARRQQTTMQDWVKYTDQFLTFSERTVLTGAGSVSRVDAEAHASREYAKYDAARKEAERIEAENEHLREIERATRQAIKERPEG
ncbi:virulence RhuM family protein [Mycobacteroides abscessus]|uniref:virulence RhuM family protein n=1 Tax=Mycobacteroides abscessus TaxID=36809 RepID=UPI0005E63DF8|nr:virulence RhuM family protein [Mycobacteroides abscessus]CPR69900.1 Virulence protein [Mycobacteroides abscessus]CPU70489.1 Virulence protein [Mycobacteroides abscessus]